MRKIKITDHKNITGWVYPEYGGMLGRLIYKEKEVFALDEDRLALSPLLGGGNPVLFPFPSKTKDDTYELDGKEYYMPFHGLVTNCAFFVEEMSDNSVVVSIKNNPSWKQTHYPFDFELKLKYEISDGEVVMTASVTNLSNKKMPHYFGWHCYFTVTDKKSAQLFSPFGSYIDYSDGRTKSGSPDLELKTDYVFFDRKQGDIVLRSGADGYAVNIEAQDVYRVLTVCSRFDGRLCVEPWIGLPDSINIGRYIEWVKPGETMEYWTKLKISEI